MASSARGRWARPRRFDRNLVVIGGGSAGLVTALVAARLGASVTLIEERAMGGDCLNTGCIPSKALVHAARLVAGARQAAAMGLLPAPGAVDSAAAFAHVRAAIRGVAPHDSAQRYLGLGVDVRLGHATLISPWTVEVAGESLAARAIVIATGAAPVVPALPGLPDVPFLTTETLWRLDRAPGRLTILGGGPVGCELAQAFARLGSAVTLVESGPRLLAREDDAVCALARSLLERDGVRVLTGRLPQGVSPGTLHLGSEDIGFDELLLAVGRAPRTRGFGLEALGIATTARGTIAVNAYLQTRFRNVLACGDVAGPFQYTHAAGHQGFCAAINALLGGWYRLSPEQHAMPAVTFTDPEIARVGLTEREARAQDIAFELTEYDVSDLDRAITEGASGFVRVLTAPGTDRMLGVTIVAPRAGEMLAEVVSAMRHRVGLRGLQASIRAYPTYGDALAQTAAAWRQTHVPEWALRWFAWWQRHRTG